MSSGSACIRLLFAVGALMKCSAVAARALHAAPDLAARRAALGSALLAASWRSRGDQFRRGTVQTVQLDPPDGRLLVREKAVQGGLLQLGGQGGLGRACSGAGLQANETIRKVSSKIYKQIYVYCNVRCSCCRSMCRLAHQQAFSRWTAHPSRTLRGWKTPRQLIRAVLD